MADTVRFYMEEMLPEMRDLEQKGLFTKVRPFCWPSESSPGQSLKRLSETHRAVLPFTFAFIERDHLHPQKARKI